MGSVSGIELGPASCVLVSARPSAAGTEVDVVHVVEPAAWPGNEVAVTALLKTTRRAKRLPRRARVVVWELEKPAPLSDPIARAAVRPLTAAGFRVEAVLTPAQGLAALAASRKRPTEGPIAWLALNTHGGAIAIVRGTEILFSRTLQWSYDGSAQAVKEQLLQRYSLVARLGPELQHALEQVRTVHGARVETVVTCGDLPDLRSLTMPLIEELDLEVETLDSADGLVARGKAARDRFAEWMPAIRVACAAATMPVRRPPFRVPAGVAAAVLLSIIGVGLYNSGERSPVLPVDTRLADRGRGQPPSPPEREQPPAPVTPVPVAPAPVTVPEPQAAEIVTPAEGRGLPPSPVATAPEPAPVRPSPTVPARAPEKKGGQQLPPVPPLTSILIDNGRRLAMIGGLIVAVGDRVGPRVVVRIDPGAVVLREPTGAEITVLLRTAGVDAVKSVPFPHANRH